MNALPEISLERGMPASPDAERSILGAILLENGHFHEAAEKLDQSDFSLDSHARIFARISSLMERGRAVDLVTLVEELAKKKEIECIGGVAYVASLTEGLPRRISIREYVDIVQEKAKLRGIITICNTGMVTAVDQVDGAEDLVSRLDRELLDVIAKFPSQEISLEQQSTEAMERIDAVRRGEIVPSYRTGIGPLDLFTGGLPVGQMTVIAGRPSRGKSSAVRQTILTNCPQGRFCHVVTPEMTATEFLNGLYAPLSGVRYMKIVNPELMSADELQRVRAAMLEVSRWPLRIDDDPAMTPDQVLARAKTIKRRNNTAILAVDYLQLLNFPGPKKDHWMEIGDTAKRLAKLAKAEQMAVALLSSLTEKSGGENIPPTLIDLRQSGDIQYHAHNVYLIHRVRDEQSQEISPDTAFIVAKKRHGRTGNVPATFDTDKLCFEDRVTERSLYD